MNFPAGISIMATSSRPAAATAVGVGHGVLVGVVVGSGVVVGGEPGVAVGAARIACASGGKVGWPGASGVTVGSLLTSQPAVATDASVTLGLPAVSEAGATGEETGRVGDEGTVGEGTANRLGNSTITTRTSTKPKISIKRVRVFFIITRFDRTEMSSRRPSCAHRGL